MAQSIFLCLTRPVFFAGNGHFQCYCKKQINRTLPLSRLLQDYKYFRQNVHSFVCPIRAETIENCGGLLILSLLRVSQVIQVGQLALLCHVNPEQKNITVR